MLSKRFSPERNVRLWLAGLIAVCLLLPRCSYADDFVFIRSEKSSALEQKGIALASDFYGVNLRSLAVDAENGLANVKAAVESESTRGVVISAHALPLVDKDTLLKEVRRGTKARLPLMIVGIDAGTDSGLLAAWTAGSVVGVKRAERANSQYTYQFQSAEVITRQLSHAEIPVQSNSFSFLMLGPDQPISKIAELNDGRQAFPVFVAIPGGPGQTFLATDVVTREGALENWSELTEAFSAVAPAFLFARYAAGDHGWHPAGHYANLTIDDAWLREPYGNLDYQGLLYEMQRHRFHSTIAFIPWNYDRSEADVVAIIRNHPDLYSISVHGDNHDHKEFTDFRDRPLPAQIAAMKQSLARMDRFVALTGLPYDKVMVFPHSIAPTKTLEGLKTYNYLGTVNSSNVPMDQKNPASLEFMLRPVTLSYENFPSVSRFGVEVKLPDGLIAINAFLENPLLFYCHQGFFADGIDSFDGVAEEVNKVQPDTRWEGLGEIMRHLYLVRSREDSTYDVLAFTRNVTLDNTSGRDATFYVAKPETSDRAVLSVKVDGRNYPFQLNNGRLELALTVPAGTTRSVLVQQTNDLATAPTNTAKNSTMVYLLRMAADFRDIELSHFTLGRSLTRVYYAYDLSPLEAIVALLIGVCLFGVWFLRRLSRRSMRVENVVAAPRGR